MKTPADRRTAITGMGVVSAAGHTLDQVWRTLESGETPEHATQHDGNAPVRAVASVQHLDFEKLLGSRMVQDTDRCTHLALAAGMQAMEDARLTEDAPDGLAVVVGTGFGGIGSIDEHMALATLNPAMPVSPLAIPKGMHNAIAFWLARQWKAFGPNLTVSTACSSGAMALVTADRMIRDGDADVVLVCGVEACLIPSVLRAWSGMRVMTTKPPGTGAFRPFDKERSGFVLGEGVACLVCEATSHASRRGAAIHGFVAATSTSCDAQSLTRPNPQRQAQTITSALERAAVTPDQLAFVNAHATATRLNDSAEALALRQALGEVAVPVQASKPFFGHTMGASGLLEFMVGLLQTQKRRLHPTPHLETVDPDCELNHVRQWLSLDDGPLWFISNSFGFGGNNVVIVGETT